MITLVHGSDQISSRNYFLEQKDKDSLTFDAEDLDIAEFKQEVVGSNLFGPSNKVFIENLFSRKAITNYSNILLIMENTSARRSAKVFVWADKIISSKQLSDFTKAEVKIFKIPQNIWSFLDGIKPNSLHNVSSFHATLSTNEQEVVFAMIVRQFRLMIGLSQESSENPDEIKRLAPWQKSKLIRQASLFGLEKLKKIYKKLYKIDKSQKTGSTRLSLVQSVDILLLDI